MPGLTAMDDMNVDTVKEKDVIKYANELLSKCNIEFTIEEPSECNCDLFLALYHAILGDFPSGTLIDCSSLDAQVHNVQCIVETLSTDYLKVDLSHITPNEVVDGNLLSLYNLLEILDGLLEYLLEKIGMDSDSGDEGDVDSDQLSDHARTMALQTIQKEMSKSLDSTLIGHSPSSTAELIALGQSLAVDDEKISQNEEFVPLQPHISHTPDLSNHADSDKEENELSNHTLHATVEPQWGQWETPVSDISVSPSEQDSIKDLPPLSKDVNDIASNLANLHVESGLDLPYSNIDGVMPPLEHLIRSPSPPKSPIVVSDSGSSMDSDTRRKALDVELEDDHTAFVLKKKRHLHSSQEESTASESVDVADGKVKLQEDEANLRKPGERPKSPEHLKPKGKDWQAMLDSLQRTVEESKKIREQYFSSGGMRSRITESSDEYQTSLGDDTATTAESLDDSLKVHRRKNVRFEDTISTKTAKELKQFQQVLQKERRLQEEKNEILARNYEDHLDEVKQAEDDKLEPLRRKVQESEKHARGELERVKKQAKRQKSRQRTNLTDAAKWKSWLSPRMVRPPPPRRIKRSPIRSGVPYSGLKTIGEHDLLPKLIEEFPHLELPPETLNDMWHKQFRQMEQLTAASSDHKTKKRRSEMKLQEAYIRHELLMSIMQKEHEHTRHMRDIKERVAGQKEAQRTLRERRLQTARIRKYYRDYQLQMRSRMMKRRTKEEKIFKRLFEDGLTIQKARLRELRKYARDKREEQQKRQMDEIQSLENYYRDQFNILAETLEDERKDLKIRDDAQAKLVRQMKRGLRQKMEKEISELQEMIVRDDEDTYFREVEADRIRRQLQLATYNAKFKA